MLYNLIDTIESGATECLIIGLCSDEDNPKFIDHLNLNALIKSLYKKIPTLNNFIWQAELNQQSLLIINCGKKNDYKLTQFKNTIKIIAQEILKYQFNSATICLPKLADRSAENQAEQVVINLEKSFYNFSFKTKDSETPKIESVNLYIPGLDVKTLSNSQIIATSINYARQLADTPANICTPIYLAEQAIDLTHHSKLLTCKIIEPEEMQQLGMNALLAVSQGSVQPPRLIELQYYGGGNTAPIILVGKGITFDSGGLSLKPANVMDEMKYDMAGAASVIATMKACAELKLPLNVIGMMACAENLPNGSAVKPGDIVTSMSGLTIEILNTDAEGRLVLADTLSYVERFNPKCVIDIATLTGAMIVALGHVHSGFMTTDEEFASLLTTAASNSGDGVWRMPLDEDYAEALQSPLADMINANFDRSAGAITAASFLAKFTKKYPWIHLDVAGTAWVSGKNRHATGRPVHLLIEFLKLIAAKANIN